MSLFVHVDPKGTLEDVIEIDPETYEIRKKLEQVIRHDLIRDTQSEYGVREFSRKLRLPVATVSWFLNSSYNTFLRVNPQTDKWRYAGEIRAHDEATREEKPGEEQHVIFSGRGIDTPYETDFQPLVKGSRAPPPGFHLIVRKKVRKRVKGGREIEHIYEARH